MKLLWLQGLTCSGNSQSFLCAEDPAADEVLNRFEVLFCPFVSWEKDEEEAVTSVLEGHEELDVLVFEGAVGKNDRRLCDMDIKKLVKRLAKKARYVIALGNCAVFGNIPGKYSQEVKGLQYRFNHRGGPRENMFETKHAMGLPEELPLGVSKRGYILLSGVAKTFAPERLKKRLMDED